MKELTDEYLTRPPVAQPHHHVHTPSHDYIVASN